MSELRLSEEWGCYEVPLGAKDSSQVKKWSLILEAATGNRDLITNRGRYPVTSFARGERLEGSSGSHMTELHMSAVGDLIAEMRTVPNGVPVAYMLCLVAELGAAAPDSLLVAHALLNFRALFMTARTPTASELRLGEKWGCYEVPLGAEGFSQVETWSLILEAATDNRDLITNRGTYPIISFARGERLEGSSESHVTELRVSSEGDLIAGTQTVPAGKFVAYLFCPLSKLGAASPEIHDFGVCGFPGEAGHTIAQRIADCADAYDERAEKTSEFGATIDLVARTDSGKQVWMDDTGLLWGDRREERTNWSDAQRVCRLLTEAEGKIPSLKWYLPTKEEYLHIGRERRGGNAVWKILPNMDGPFWSSTRSVKYSWYFHGHFGDIANLNPNHYVATRCVARP